MNPSEAQLALATSAAVLAEHPRLRGLHAAPLRVAVTIPLEGWKLRDLHSLREGSLLVTACPAAEDVPVYAGGVLLGWAELDSLDGRMAIRLTRLSEC